MGNTWPADGNNIDNPNNTVVMAKKIKLELTEAQFEAMCDLADTISAQRGSGEEFTKEAKEKFESSAQGKFWTMDEYIQYRIL